MNLVGKMLVVDDHVALAENIAEILNGTGLYAAITADSAEAALHIIANGGIGGLITDYRLPGQSGAQLIAALRRSGSQMPAVVMSAYTDDETIRISRDSGAMAVLAKPLDLDTLLSTAESMGDA